MDSSIEGALDRFPDSRVAQVAERSLHGGTLGNRSHQAEVALLYQIQKRHPAPDKRRCDADDVPEIELSQPVACSLVAMPDAREEVGLPVNWQGFESRNL